MDGVVFVEIPSGSRNKYEWDDELGGIALDRRLFTSMSYPADYGFFEGTLAEDGDPLDALVLVGEPTFPGCRIRVRAVGVFHMADEKGPDEKVICVPLNDPSWSGISDIHDVPRAAPQRDRALLPGLQGPRGRQHEDERVREPGRGAGDHRGLPRTCALIAAITRCDLRSRATSPTLLRSHVRDHQRRRHSPPLLAASVRLRSVLLLPRSQGAWLVFTIRSRRT